MKNKFFGWSVVYAGGALQFLQSMLLNQAFGIYLAVLIEDRGWSKTSISGAAALKSTEVALLGPILGWLVDKYGAKSIVRLGIVMFGIGFMLLSRVHTIYEFYGAFVVIAFGSSMFSNPIVSVAIIQWFQKKRARALSMLQFGGAIGGLFVFIIAFTIQTFGWRYTAFGSGVVAILIGYPLARLIRNKPEEYGQFIDGVSKSESLETQSQINDDHEFTVREAIRTSSFWLIAFGHAFSLLVVTAINVHAVAHIKEGLGFSLAQASLIFTLVTIGQFFGVMLGWVIGEKFDKRLVAATCMLMHACGLLMITYASSLCMLIFAALLHGTGWGLRGPFMHAIRADYFGRKSIGMIIGISTLVTVLGTISGPIVAGAFADSYGNYRYGFTLLAILAGVGSLFFLIAKKPKIPKIPKIPKST